MFLGKRTRDFAFVSLRYGRSGEEICTGYMPWPPAAECNMITKKKKKSFPWQKDTQLEALLSSALSSVHSIISIGSV